MDAISFPPLKKLERGVRLAEEARLRDLWAACAAVPYQEMDVTVLFEAAKGGHRNAARRDRAASSARARGRPEKRIAATPRVPRGSSDGRIAANLRNGGPKGRRRRVGPGRAERTRRRRSDAAKKY